MHLLLPQTRQANVSSPPAQLILTTGSRAGMVAPIRLGYYLIGRDSECQIRPKTRSVSRTHCLLFLGSGSPDPNKRGQHDPSDPSLPIRMHVFDLNSTSGTKINGQRVPVRVWKALEDGVELRCGKIAWQVVVRPVVERPTVIATQPQAAVTVPGEPFAAPVGDLSETSAELPTETGMATVHDSGLIEAGSLTPGKAWQEEDVAAFLAAHDDVDRANRYDQIRQTAQAREERFGGADPDDPFEEEPSGHFAESSTGLKQHARSESTASSKPGLPSKLKKRVQAKRSLNLPWEKIKLLAAFVATLVVIGLFASKLIEFTSGPPVEVRQGID